MMPRRKKPYRKAGPKVWIAAILLVAALFAWGDDDPRLQQLILEVVSEFVPFSPVADFIWGGGTRVIDGDTLDLNGKRIRLHGIDAPETRQMCYRGRRAWPCGTEATKALRHLIGFSDVQCQKTSTDRYGRTVATCRTGRHNVNAWMVRNGWAVAYRQYGGAAYAADEAVARRARAGIWAGRFVMPWDWRKGKR